MCSGLVVLFVHLGDVAVAVNLLDNLWFDLIVQLTGLTFALN
jgi:hypothetical protein